VLLFLYTNQHSLYLLTMLFQLLLFPLLASCLPIAQDAAKTITTVDHMFPSGFVLTAHVDNSRTTSTATKKAVAISYAKRSAAQYPYPVDFHPYPTPPSPVTVRAGVTAVKPPGNGGWKRRAPFPEPTGKEFQYFQAPGEVSKRAPKGALRWGLNIMNLLEEDDFGVVILRQKATDMSVGGDMKVGGTSKREPVKRRDPDQERMELDDEDESDADASEENNDIVEKDDGQSSSGK
jgi:hypothetical protein